MSPLLKHAANANKGGGNIGACETTNGGINQMRVYFGYRRLRPAPSPQSARKKQLGMAQPGGLNGGYPISAGQILSRPLGGADVLPCPRSL